MRYLIDSSALHRRRHRAVADVLDPLIQAGRVHICPVTEMELLYSARNLSDFERTAELVRLAFCWAPMPDEAWERAKEIQHALARAGQHRGAGVPDLLLAATAERHRLTILHYDHDFDTIAAVTGQPTQWVVPPATV